MQYKKTNHSKFQKDGGWCFECVNCKKRQSIRINTVFEASNKRFSDFIELIYVFAVLNKTVCDFVSYLMKFGL